MPAPPSDPKRTARRPAAATRRWVLLLWTTAYFVLLSYVYMYRLERWEYLGFWYAGTDAPRLATCYVLAMLPLAWMDTRIARFSSFIHWIIYLFIYVPAVLIPVLQGLNEDVMNLSFAIFASFSLITLLPVPQPGPAPRPIGRKAFWSAFWGVYAVLFGYALYVFRDNLSLSSLYDVYGQRAIASDVATGTLVGYATGVLAGCMNPFLMTIGLLHRRPALFAVALVGQVFVYATFALKSVLVSVLILLIFHATLLRGERIRIWRLVGLVCLSIALPLAIAAVVDVDESPFVENLVALVFMRTYGMVGALTGVYHEFFANHDLTYFSHVNIVRLFVDYPYDLSIGEVIGESLGYDLNSNANFFATDGIASAGKTGVVIVGAIMAAVLGFADRWVPARSHRLLCIASAPVAISLANSSVFTTLLTGGLLLLIVLARFWHDGLLRPSKPGRHHRLAAPTRHAPV
jgi:hypothetical protein